MLVHVCYEHPCIHLKLHAAGQQLPCPYGHTSPSPRLSHAYACLATQLWFASQPKPSWLSYCSAQQQAKPLPLHHIIRLHIARTKASTPGFISLLTLLHHGCHGCRTVSPYVNTCSSMVHRTGLQLPARSTAPRLSVPSSGMLCITCAIHLA